MVKFEATIQRFSKQGDKTGWTYVLLPSKIVSRVKPGTRLTFRVKGKLDNFPIAGVALLPMGEGDFIMPLNAKLRKGIAKPIGAKLTLQLEEDKAPFKFNTDFLECLSDDVDANEFFQTLTPSHQRYFSKWIDDAKTVETKSKRIAQSLNALSRKMGYPEMIRSNQKKNREP